MLVRKSEDFQLVSYVYISEQNVKTQLSAEP